MRSRCRFPLLHFTRVSFGPNLRTPRWLPRNQKRRFQCHSWGPSCRKRPASPCGLAAQAWGPALRRLSGYTDPSCMLITPQAPWSSPPHASDSVGTSIVLRVHLSRFPACPAGYRSHPSQLLGRIRDLGRHQQRLGDIGIPRAWKVIPMSCLGAA